MLVLNATRQEPAGPARWRTGSEVVGYRTLTPGNANRRADSVVLCRPGLDEEATALVAATGLPATAGVLDEAAAAGMEGAAEADCVVIIGARLRRSPGLSPASSGGIHRWPSITCVYTESERIVLKQRRAWIAVACAAAMLFAGHPAALGAKRARPPKGGDLERKRDDASAGSRSRSATTSTWPRRRRRSSRSTSGEIAADLADRQAEAADAQSDADQAAASVVKITADIAALKVELVHRKEIFNRRAVMAYMGGQGRPLDDLSLAGELLALPSNLTDVARRSERS